MQIEFSNRFKIQDFNVECHLHLRPGRLTLLSGENGVGKSSLIQFLKLNQVEFFKGNKVVFIDQFPLSPVNGISYAQLEAFLASSREEELACYLDLKDEINQYSKRPINDLSGGQNQLVKIALGIYLSGDVFILDEPFQYLDHKNVLLLKSLLSNLKLLNKSILIVEHRKEIIKDLVDDNYEMLKDESIKVIESGS